MGNSEKGDRDVRGDAPVEPVKSKPYGSKSLQKEQDETEIFKGGPGSRLFGEGYAPSGGPVAQGNYADPDANSHTGTGTFNDAGGPGSSQLLGDENKDVGAGTASQTNQPPRPRTKPRDTRH
jgi:hypothetical protein